MKKPSPFIFLWFLFWLLVWTSVAFAQNPPGPPGMLRDASNAVSGSLLKFEVKNNDSTNGLILGGTGVSGTNYDLEIVNSSTGFVCGNIHNTPVLQCNVLLAEGTAGYNPPAGNLEIAGLLSVLPTFGADGEGAVYLNTVNGLSLEGRGSSTDVEIINSANGSVCGNPHASNAWSCQSVLVTSTSGNNPAVGQLELGGSLTVLPTLGGNGAAAVFTSTLNGLDLMGQGSTNDVTLFNASGTLVANIAHGTTTLTAVNLTVTTTLTLNTVSGTQCLQAISGVVSGTGLACGSGGGAPTILNLTGTLPSPSAGTLIEAGSSTVPTFAASNEGAIWVNNTSGLSLMGDGGTGDITLYNKAGTQVCQITTGTTIWTCPGLAVSGSAVPGNGFYLVTTNDIGFSVNSTLVLDVTQTRAAFAVGIREQGAFSSPATGEIDIAGPASAPSAPGNGWGGIWESSASGLLLMGQGSTRDVALIASTGIVVAGIPTGTSNFSIVNGDLLDRGVAPTGTAGTGYVRATSPTIVSPTITTSFTATGLVTLADMANETANTILGNSTGSPAAPQALPIGTGVATALGINVGSAGAFVTFNGAGGTPSSLALTNATGLPPSGIAAIAANSTLRNNTASSAAPTAVATQVSKTSNYTVLAADNTTNFDNIGAAGPVAFALPPSPVATQSNCFVSVTTAPTGQQVSVTLGGSTLWNGTQSTTDFITTNVAGKICVEAQSSTVWVAKVIYGTWTMSQPAFYVATGGNDGNAGSLASPFATITKCQTAMQSSSNKTCYIRAGTYTPASIANCWWGGAETCALGVNQDDTGETFSVYWPDGARSAIVNGQATNGATGIQWGITSNQSDTAPVNFAVTGLKLENFAAGCIQFSQVGNNSPPSNLTISFNECNTYFADGSNNSVGIGCSGCINLTINNNYITAGTGWGIQNGSNAGANGVTGNVTISGNVIISVCSGFADCAGIYVQDFTSMGPKLLGSINITNNFVRDGNTNSTATGGGGIGAGIYLDNCTQNTYVTGNIVTGHNGGTAFQHNALSYNVVRGNIFDLGTNVEYIAQLAAGNQQCGGSIGASNWLTQAGNIFEQNIILAANASGTVGGFYGVANTTSGSWTIGGSILNTGNDYKEYGAGTLTSGSATGSSVSYSDANPITVDPGFSGCYAMVGSTASTIHKTPINFTSPPNVLTMGPPGFTIPVSSGGGTHVPSYGSPSC